jgi:hypothetical protein
LRVGTSTWRSSHRRWGGGDRPRRPTANLKRQPHAAGPGDLVPGGKGDLQEAERFQLACPTEGASVNGTQPTRGDHLGDERLGISVITGNQDRRRVITDNSRVQRRREVGVESLDDTGLGKCCCDLRSRRTVRRHRQGVKGLKVQRVGDVDNYLPRQLVATQ